MEINPIGYIESNYKTKFGIPRQSGIVQTPARIILNKEFRCADAFRGLDEFSHIWVLWEFSECADSKWSPTVRPPRLGGNKRMGVFATRSPFRPNSIGLSSVKLVKIDFECENAPVIYISGADIKDGTPVYDIKPYLPYTDCHMDASGGFSDKISDAKMRVEFVCCTDACEEIIGEITQILENDPRPSYQDNPDRIYGMEYGKYSIRFKVDDKVITVFEIAVTQMK